MASCFRGAFPPVDLRAVCFVRAIFNSNRKVTDMMCNKYELNIFILSGLLSDWSKTMRFHWTIKTTSKVLSFICNAVFRSLDTYQYFGLMEIVNAKFSS